MRGDDLINHENSDVLSEYDKSENSLIVVLNTSIQMLLKPLPLPRIPCFINIKVSFKSTRTTMIQDVFNLDQSTGGSTLLKELVKTKCYQVKTYSRKANELILAMRLENLLSK